MRTKAIFSVFGRKLPSKRVVYRAHLLAANGKGFVFSEDGGETPVAVYRIRSEFDKALERIGTTREEKLN